MTGMLLNGWHSDRSDERLVHVAVPIFIASLGMLLAGVTGNPVFVAVGMGMVVFGHNTMLPVFWCLPSSFLRGAGAAAGIGLINSLGNLGGFFGPNLFGSVKNATGNYSLAFFFLAALALIASMVSFTLRRAKALADCAWNASRRLERPYRLSAAAIGLGRPLCARPAAAVSSRGYRL